MKQVYDNIRQQWVAATPEEIVRQRWIQKMVNELGFPKELLVIERELKMLPHLKQHPYPLPTRRVDVLSFGKGAAAIFPLLLIECKDGPLSQQALEQALAYNTFVQAYYVAVVNQDQIRLKYIPRLVKKGNFFNQTRYRGNCLEYLPSFKDLMEAVSG